MQHPPELANQFAETVFNKISFLIKHGIWSSVTQERFHRWKEQFQTDEERYFAAYLAYQLLYYGKKDFLCLMTWAYTEVIRTLAKQRLRGSSISDPIWEKTIRNVQRGLMVCPFAVDTPAASGNMVVRFLRNQGLINEAHLYSADQLVTILGGRHKYKAIVFVEDMIGSGDQARKFYLEPKNFGGNSIVLRDVIRRSGLPAYLAVAIAPRASVQAIQDETGLRVVAAEVLTERNSPLEPSFWVTDKFDEFEDGQKFLDELNCLKKIKKIGYNENSWTVAFDHGAPNVTCPFYYFETSKWTSLVPRRGEEI